MSIASIAAVAASRAVHRAMALGSASKPIAAGLMFFRSRIARAQFDGIYSPPAIKSESGTFATYRLHRSMSAFRGNPEDMCMLSSSQFDPTETSAALVC